MPVRPLPGLRVTLQGTLPDAFLRERLPSGYRRVAVAPDGMVEAADMLAALIAGAD
jgi:hypothetical protein